MGLAVGVMVGDFVVGTAVGDFVVGTAVGALVGLGVVVGTPVGKREGFTVGDLLLTGERVGWTNEFGSHVVPGVHRVVYPSSDNCLRAALKSGHQVSCPTVDLPSNTVDVMDVPSIYPCNCQHSQMHRSAALYGRC